MKYFTLGLSFWLLSSIAIASAADKAPALELKSLHGITSTLEDYRGDVIYLDFWATWCAPCRKSFPWMNKMQAKYEAQGLKIIAISLDEKPERIKSFLKKHPALFDIMIDPDAVSADIYKVRGMPSSYIIDRKGRLIGSHAGFRTKDEPKLEKMIQQALASS